MPRHQDNPRLNSSSLPQEVLVFGDGDCARRIAANLTACAIPVCLAASERSEMPDESADAHALAFSGVEGCLGYAGHFDLRLNNKDGRIQKTVSAIVVAPETMRSANHAVYGLTPGPRVVDISTLEEHLRNPGGERPLAAASSVVFLSGGQKESLPTVTRRMLDACYCLQHELGATTYFLTGNLKVAEKGSEARVQEAKQAGAVFFKFTDADPVITALSDDRFGITYKDELTRTDFRLEADWIVVDESVAPADGLPELTRILGIDRDATGFAQADNVRRLSNLTSRRGIFVAGGGRGVFSADEQSADADRVSMRVLAFLRNLDEDPRPPASIQQGRCARCLTCYRLCPHGAIDIGAHISIVSEACQRCGVCVGGCPGGAIEMEGSVIDDAIAQDSAPPQPALKSLQTRPRVVVFGCSRSAGQALAGTSLPPNVRFIEVPCGGSIAERHLLRAFEAGTTGVMLCTCHTDNCQSEIGNRIARRRATSVKDALRVAGVTDERLCITSTAANMGNELVQRIEQFVGELVGRSDG